MNDHYSDDLAYIHHVGYGDFARTAAPGIVRQLREAGWCDGQVVDLGCGSGILAGELCRAGYDVIGVDQSAGMLKLARRHAPNAIFKHESYLQTKLPKNCVCVAAIGEIFCYLFDESVGKKTLIPFLQKVYDALVPGGLLIFDVATPQRLRADGQKQGGVSGDDWAMVMRVTSDEKRLRLTRHLTIFRKVGKLYRRSSDEHTLQLYRSSEIAAALRKIGFRVRYTRRYGDVPLPDGLTGFIARK